MLRCLILFTLAALCAATDSPDGPFDKAGLEVCFDLDKRMLGHKQIRKGPPKEEDDADANPKKKR